MPAEVRRAIEKIEISEEDYYKDVDHFDVDMLIDEELGIDEIR